MKTKNPLSLIASLWKNPHIRYALILSVLGVLGYSFWFSTAWLMLCYGLALFLFGMQCIETGLHQATGGTLERIMAKTTSSPAKGFAFGVGATFVLQSSTLVSLLTIAFLSTGMISLAGGLSIIFGTNLGATSGIWLLALMGQSISLNTFALPMLVFGVLMGFMDKRLKAVGQALIGISLIFLGIDAIKEGFSGANDISFSQINVHGFGQVLMFVVVGFLLTCVLQSSHATLILTLSALSAGQISVVQGFAIAVGSNLGSSVTTALVGMIGSEKNGQRLALAHLIFNVVTAILSIILWMPLTYGTAWVADLFGIESDLLKLALFHTLFNLLGVAIFWGKKEQFANKLTKWLPQYTHSPQTLPDNSEPVQPKYLQSNLLLSADTAMHAINQETHRLTTLGLEVICHAIYVPNDELRRMTGNLPKPESPLELDVQTLYSWQIKPLYGAILDFGSRLDIDDNMVLHQKLTLAQLRAFHIVEIIKESKHLQKNMQQFLSQSNNAIHGEYLHLREHLFEILLAFLHIHELPIDNEERIVRQNEFIDNAETLNNTLSSAILEKLHQGKISGLQTASLLNDINYIHRINLGLGEILQFESQLMQKS
ncbi:Na/Pi cotransporter family protein [Moraxella oblonga]|uniref:Na/Pi cotransporter family protein n=1 Tax=Moraxella oblonga TaxID=200413 RepID=UPI00082C6817|nr:Na/Pi symporter [Moraxella oblonga]